MNLPEWIDLLAVIIALISAGISFPETTNQSKWWAQILAYYHYCLEARKDPENFRLP